MGAFRYYFGFLYIVYHEKKGFWNNDVKKYVKVMNMQRKLENKEVNNDSR